MFADAHISSLGYLWEYKTVLILRISQVWTPYIANTYISCVHENHISSLPNLTHQTAQSNLIALIISYHLTDPGGTRPLQNTGEERWEIFSTMRKALWYE